MILWRIHFPKPSRMNAATTAIISPWPSYSSFCRSLRPQRSSSRQSRACGRACGAPRRSGTWEGTAISSRKKRGKKWDFIGSVLEQTW